MNQLTLPMPASRFDGETYDEARDGERLRGLLLRVYTQLADGQWHTLRELSQKCGGSEASVSARLRDLRKPAHGSHRVEHEFVSRGLWRYRLAA